MPDKNRIAELREEIDDINLKLLELLNRRATVASEIGKLQIQYSSQIYDPVRESAMLTELQMVNEGPFSNETLNALFKEIFKATLALEEKEARANLVVQRKTPDQQTIIEMADGTQIGNSDFQIIAGPCAIESYEQYEEVAAALADEGIKIMRAMAFKPRTSPYDFQGLGEPGLKIARQVANKYGLLLVSEIMDASQLHMMTDYVDMLWIGARNMQNPHLLRAVGKTNKPVILKRHFAAKLQEFLYAAEYIMSEGNHQVILMERGIRSFDTWTRNTLDISAVPLLKKESHLPVIVDISHSAGRRDIANPLARVAVASGADGLMVEVHPNPDVAMSDAKQQLNIAQFKSMMAEVRKMLPTRAVKKEHAGD
ncbi:MAG: bifunctional 3-deoxy-7-phosphoheptulonate synthase/chorismate mutase [Anaerolineae bacterium]|nr:bifunctional 3-deoxy-7-phosphoheptulonate synthase/chorismate mutase [Anaerolineae bacterium]